jgi:hypothetical protein
LSSELTKRLTAKDRSIALVFGALFVAASAGIVYGTASRGLLALESERWPTVPGTIVDAQSNSDGLRVLTRYVVDGRVYETGTVSISLFPDDPGGRGRRESIVARYPIGAAVPVHVRPGHPDVAALEPANVGTFLFPPLIGVLFGGPGLYWLALGIRGAQPTRPSPARAQRVVGWGISALLALSLATTLADSAAQETFAVVLRGRLPPWLNPTVAVGATLAVLGLPLPWLVGHQLRLSALGVNSVSGVVLRAIGGGPEARSARIISAAIAVFLAFVAAWVTVASWHGV